MTIARDAILGLPQGVYDPRDLGPLFESGLGPGGLVPYSRTDARSRDVEQLQTKYPWATQADQWMFLLGWERGEAYAYDNPRKREKASVAVTSSPPLTSRTPGNRTLGRLVPRMTFQRASV